MPVNTETVTYNDMIIGGFPVKTRAVTVVSGAGVLARGTVLGQITSGGKYKTALSASSDGSEAPKYILAADIDASDADASALVYVCGDFDSSKLTFGAGITAAAFDAANAAADRLLFIHTPV